ncbi:MAG: FecR domain-containing protein [Rhodospirillales bacterium]
MAHKPDFPKEVYDADHAAGHDADHALAGLDTASRQAVEWLARRHDPDTTGFDARAFQAWLAETPRNRRAFAEIEALWQAGGTAAAPARPTAALSRRAFGRRALAAGIAALAVTGAGTLALAPEPADFRTAPGETAHITLPDGTAVDLSTDTALRLVFSGRERRVELLSGEAFFAVARDTARPFRVAAGETMAEALGTAFSVARTDDGARVTVTEHSVAVTARGERRVVTAGQHVVASAMGGHLRLGPIEGANIERDLSWRAGKLVFLDRPLGEVVANLDRWRRGRTVILDGALAARPVTVVLDTRRAGNAVPILARAVPLRWADVTPYLTLVYAAD